MSEHFQAKVSSLQQMSNGLISKVVETYLIDAMSFTEAEARAIRESEGSREVTAVAIARSNIKEVVMYGDTDLFFKVKVQYSLMDEETEKEKKITTYLLVNANDAREAYDRTEEHLKEMLVPFQIPKVELSQICEVFQYEKQAPKGFLKVETLPPATLKLTADLLQRRDDVKRLFGDKYDEKVMSWIPVIEAGMKHHGTDNPFNAVIEMTKEKHVDELTGSLMIATAVEMVENDREEFCAMESDSIEAIDPTDGQAVAFDVGDEAERIYMSLHPQKSSTIANIFLQRGPSDEFVTWLQAYIECTNDVALKIARLLEGNDAAFEQDEEDNETDLKGRLNAVYQVDPLWQLLYDNGVVCLDQDLHEIRGWKDSPFRDFHECMDAQFDATETVSRIVFEYLKTEIAD